MSLWKSAAKFLATAFVLLASLLAITDPGSAGSLDEIKARGKLIVGVKTDSPPFGYVDAQGNNVGFDVDLARRFAQAMFGDPGKIDFVTVTSGNRIPFLQSKKIDIIMASVTITPEREQVVQFSKPYFVSGGLVLVKSDSNVAGLDQLTGKSVAVIQGSGHDPYVEKAIPTASRTKYGKVSDAVLALKTGRVDGFVHDDIVVLTVARENPDLKPVGSVFNPLPFGLAVRKDDPELAAWVDSQMADLRRTGAFDKLWDSHFGAIAAKLIKP